MLADAEAVNPNTAETKEVRVAAIETTQADPCIFHAVLIPVCGQPSVHSFVTVEQMGKYLMQYAVHGLQTRPPTRVVCFKGDIVPMAAPGRMSSISLGGVTVTEAAPSTTTDNGPTWLIEEPRVYLNNTL